MPLTAGVMIGRREINRMLYCGAARPVPIYMLVKAGQCRAGIFT